MRTISAETKSRLCRAADEAHGWKLKKTKEDMLRVRERAQVKNKRLLETKRTLTAEVQAVKKAKHDAVSAATTQHKQKLSNVKKLLRDKFVMTHGQHHNDITKLHRQNKAVRQETRDQRNKFKETIRVVEQQSSLLEESATAALLEVQSCTRQLNVESCLTRDLKAKLQQMVDESNTKETELNHLEGTNKELSAELLHVTKLLGEAEAHVFKLEKVRAEKDKKVEHLEDRLLRAKANLRGQNLRVLDLCQVRTLFFCPLMLFVFPYGGLFVFVSFLTRI